MDRRVNSCALAKGTGNLHTERKQHSLLFIYFHLSNQLYSQHLFQLQFPASTVHSVADRLQELKHFCLTLTHGSAFAARAYLDRISDIIIKLPDVCRKALSFADELFSFFTYLGSRQPRKGRPSNAYRRFDRRLNLIFSTQTRPPLP